MPDAWRLALGTFTVVPVSAPAIDGRTAGRAMLLAPVTALVLLLGWVPLGAATGLGVLPAPVAALLALAVLALGSRALHLDGLADLADGLTASRDPARSLEVMRRGDTGPAGAAALVLVLGVDAAALSSLSSSAVGLCLAGTAVLASRLAPAVCARRGTPAARPEGLGQAVAGTVRRAEAALAALVTAAGAALVTALAGGAGLSCLALAGPAAVVLGATTAALLVRRHAVRRLGGITGDVIGAAVELALATALVVATVALGLASGPSA